MANHASTKKSIRKTKTRTARNRSQMSAMKTSIRKIKELIAAADKGNAQEALKSMQSAMMKAARKRLIHKNTMARTLSRVSHQVKSIS